MKSLFQLNRVLVLHIVKCLLSCRNCEGPEVAQLQLRFCWLETSCEQDDHFPPNLMVRINNRMVQLPVSSMATHGCKHSSQEMLICKTTNAKIWGIFLVAS